MRLALLSDVHGNTVALDAVLDDVAAQGGVDVYWALGDLAAIGPDPLGAVERLRALPDVGFTRGNTDRYITVGDRPGPPASEVAADPDRLARVVEAERAFAWSQGVITGAGLLDWFERLPMEQRLTLPDGTRLLGVHASPGRDDGPGLTAEQSDAEIGASLDGCDAELVVAGHTHRPIDRRVGDVHVVNLGSVSLPPTPDDLRASYVLLDASEDGYRVEHRRVDYDRDAVIEHGRRVRYPGTEFVASILRGGFG